MGNQQLLHLRREQCTGSMRQSKGKVKQAHTIINRYEENKASLVNYDCLNLKNISGAEQFLLLTDIYTLLLMPYIFFVEQE